MIDMLTGRSTLVVGLEECGDGQLLKVYIAARYRHLYVLVAEPVEQDRIRNAWGQGGHLWMPVPQPEHIEQDGLPAAAAGTDETGGDDQ